MKYLFLAEKPSAMRSIKEAYEKSNKPLGQVDFFALAGHLCKLNEPKHYEGWNVPWNDRPLPMIPENFKVGPLNKESLAKLEGVIKKGNYDAIIVGTDSDVEGNGIYDLIETYLGLQDYKAYRFFESALTPVEIMRSMNNLQDYHTNPRDVGMTEAYRIRSRFDWLIGFNMSVAYTVRSGFLMKVGRVKAPTLKLVYDNCNAIDNFKKSVSYQPMIETHDGKISAGMIDDDGKAKAFPKKEDAQRVLDSLSGKVSVKEAKSEIKKTNPDKLYKLTDIQYEAGLKYGYTPEKTLELIQSLYETHKLISYPRTDGRYVSSEKAKDFPRLLKAVEKMPGLEDLAKAVKTSDIQAVQANKSYVNDEKVQESSHDALIPTGETAAISKLNQDEKNICDMIFRRFLAIFFPPLKEEKRKVVLEDGDNRFSCNGSKVLDPGYTVLFKTPGNNELPDVKEGDVLNVTNKDVHEVVTSPPKRLTQATLIKAMENIQNYIEGKELKEAAKKAGGIGQPSSRAAIISELISTGYMEDKKGLYITEEGRKYIENLSGSSIVNPELSAEWEVRMTDLKNRKVGFDELYTQILDYLREALQELDRANIQKARPKKEAIGKCPVCGKDFVEYKKCYGCSGYPDCKTLIPKEIAGKMIPLGAAKTLLKSGKTSVIKGFKSKEGKSFDSALVFNDGKVTWAPFKQPTDCKCPKCGGIIMESSKAFDCEKEDCDFIIWRNISGHMLTNKEVKDLLSGKNTKLIDDFVSNKTGSNFSACLTIKDGKLSFIFKERNSKK